MFPTGNHWITQARTDTRPAEEGVAEATAGRGDRGERRDRAWHNGRAPEEAQVPEAVT